MEILNIVGIGVVAAILVVIKEERPEIAVQVSIIVGIMIFIIMINKILSVISILESLSRRANMISYIFNYTSNNRHSIYYRIWSTDLP